MKIETRTVRTEIKTAHGRVQNALARGRGVMTPKGRVYARPTACQVCGQAPKPARCWGGGTQTNLQAHHPIGYGTERQDLTVIFVCRPCHAVLHGKEKQ